MIPSALVQKLSPKMRFCEMAENKIAKDIFPFEESP